MSILAQSRASWRVIGIAAAAGAVISTAALAEDVKLRLGHTWAANHYIQTELLDVFAATVEERSGGSMTFEFYPAGQLGKDIPGTLHSGLIDMGAIATGSYPELFPLSSVGELPQAAATACEGSVRSGTLAKPGGILDEQEWKPQEFRVLTANMLAPYGLFARGFEINSPEDLEGRKIWASGPAAESAIRALDGVPIRIPSTELYDSAMRGTLDAAIFPYSGMIQYELAPILNSTANGVGYGSGVFFLVINNSVWDSLDDSQRQILEGAAVDAEQSFCKYIDNIDLQQRATAAAIDGFTVTELEGEGLSEFEQKLRGVAEAWAATFDGAGLPGTAVLEAYRAVPVE